MLLWLTAENRLQPEGRQQAGAMKEKADQKKHSDREVEEDEPGTGASATIQQNQCQVGTHAILKLWTPG